MRGEWKEREEQQGFPGACVRCQIAAALDLGGLH